MRHMNHARVVDRTSDAQFRLKNRAHVRDELRLGAVEAEADTLAPALFRRAAFGQVVADQASEVGRNVDDRRERSRAGAAPCVELQRLVWEVKLAFSFEGQIVIE